MFIYIIQSGMWYEGGSVIRVYGDLNKAEEAFNSEVKHMREAKATFFFIKHNPSAIREVSCQKTTAFVIMHKFEMALLQTLDVF